MPENKPSRPKPRSLHFRAKLPSYFRYAAFCVLALTVMGVGIGFYRARNNAEFRMQGFPTSLSKDVVAEVNGYERRETEGELVRYYIKADKAITYADNHQELHNVYLQVFDSAGQAFDQITAAKAVYIPEENKNFTGYFAGSVDIATRDGLKVKTEQVTYKKATETATADEQVNFEREGVRGRSFGALVNVPEKRLELLRDVQIETFESPELAATGARQSLINCGYATYDQLSEKIELRDGVKVNARSADSESDVESARADVFLIERSENGRDITKIELFESVRIVTRQGGGQPTTINSGYAVYERAADRFDLQNGVHIATIEGQKPVNVRSGSAIYEQRNAKIFVNENAEVTQGNDQIKGDHIVAELFPSKKLKSSVVKGNASLRQTAPDRTTEISGEELNAAFDEAQHLVTANALGNGMAVLVPVNAVEYSKVSMTAPSAIRVAFKTEGRLEKMFTEGRTTIQLDVPGGAGDAANKRVTADAVKTFFNPEGKDIQRAEAVGSAELFVEPHQAKAENYRTTINAPRFDCEFFPTGNNARVCVAAAKTKTVRVPTIPSAERGTQTLLADKLTANFNQQTKDVELYQAGGAAKFSELDRNAIADQIAFAQGDEVVRLRGGEPTVWDARARAKADEIDWDTRNEKSYLRGQVSTAYYSQKQTGGATPFGQTDKPVYLTAASAEIDHRTEQGVYSGNARGWQENNYVRAERFLIQQPQGQFFAEGKVQSLLYNAKRREGDRESTVPVYASSQKMAYNRDSRILRYEGDVDIRQGSDRIVGGAASVLLDERSEVVRSDIENNVVITQPKRRASGDFAQYTAANESVVLRGNPARVEDAESGSSQGGTLTVYFKENRVIGEGNTKANPSGRTRSVYKVKGN